ncbi:unnamed protein product [Allacma fusca]|uniref:CHK kinase-like domain-containing protein n=1 Tax=Allacma fusca TaxID=39272 RepID=A0A8J2P0I4_9HEXA|nr:unnamed protein product [Allacma fusca]
MLPRPPRGGQTASGSQPNLNNNNNNMVHKRNYPFEEGRSDSKVAKICEISFRPLIQKVFPDSEILKLKVRIGTMPGDNFTSVIYAVEALLKSSVQITVSGQTGDLKTGARVSDQVNSTDPSQTQVLHLIMKCFPNHPARQDFFRKIDIFRKELDVYRFLLPELIQFEKQRFPLSNDSQRWGLLSAFPHFYGGAYGDDYNRYWEHYNNGQIAHGNFILVEDLRKTQGYRMASKYVGLDLPHCSLVVQEIAKLHALSMAYIKVKLENSSSLSDHFDCLKETIVTPQTEEVASTLFNASFLTSVEIVKQETGCDSIYSQKMRQFGNQVHWIFGHILAGNTDMSLEEMLKIKPNFEDLHDQNKTRKRNNWYVLTHGDCYVNNILFKYEPKTNQPISVKLVDFQLARENCLTIDLVNFIYLSTTQNFRQENLNKVLQVYYHSFIEYCRELGVEPYDDFSMGNLKRKFHHAKIWGMINSLFVLPVVLADAADEQFPLDRAAAGEELNASQMFDQLLKQGSKRNEKLATRVVQLVQEMAEEGVI